ncbi:SDR family oxidoreductase [Williamsia phyllosphaerae]|uniref:Oxidoreductase n=1 Tax=Williamsia phyllosphaerae TaxID=885042 RepID=A0ABQ1UM24_9NOCA|nr:SDR family oxidoreductase [Williamsia phyllosphaerae]GGF19883.1 oxidoreductase [Williamsia phyllosphaerae]
MPTEPDNATTTPRGAERTLDGVTVVITGASSGIGASTAEALAGAGATVALFARRKDRLDELTRTIEGRDTGAAKAYGVDVTDADAVSTAIDAVATEFGGIDILVNCAGVGTWGPAVDAKLADWTAMVDVNVNGVFAATHAALPHLVAAAKGPRGISDIVNVSSIAGRRVPSFQSNVYAATKHAVGAFSEGLRQELAPEHVRVGVVEPGIVTTEMTTSGEEHAPDASTIEGLGALDPDDIAAAIVYIVTRPRHAAVNEVLIRPTEQVR